MINLQLFIIINCCSQVKTHLIMNQASLVIVTCYGITKDPETNDFMMVTKYARNNLRQYLNKSFNSLGWSDKLSKLRYTALGLNAIHEKGLIHRYFHCGN